MCFAKRWQNMFCFFVSYHCNAAFAMKNFFTVGFSGPQSANFWVTLGMVLLWSTQLKKQFWAIGIISWASQCATMYLLYVSFGRGRTVQVLWLPEKSSILTFESVDQQVYFGIPKSVACTFLAFPLQAVCLNMSPRHPHMPVFEACLMT